MSMFELTRAEHYVDNSSTCHLWIQRKKDPKFASLKSQDIIREQGSPRMPAHVVEQSQIT